jgi:Kef-type K+ transport system membrane component KefB
MPLDQPHDILHLFLGLAVLLGTARVLGEVLRRLHQPAVVGELLAGVLLGPTVFGHIWPDAFASLFPREGPSATALSALALVGATLFLLVAGLEVDLSRLRRLGRPTLAVGVAGMVAPFALGFAAAAAWPDLLGQSATKSPLEFPLFFATALSISALPVIARTLMDLKLYRSDFGTVVVGAAVLNDLVGWLIFAVLLGLLNGAPAGVPFVKTLVWTVGLGLGVLTVGRAAMHRVLPWVETHLSFAGGVLGVALTATFLGAALAEWIGLHAVFGAFLVGVALGDSSHLREPTRGAISDFVGSLFAPLFFASIGLGVDFAQSFDLTLVLAVLGIACAGKIFGCALGARVAGMPKRQAWAVGFAMNGRGAMEIILGLLARQAGLVDDRMFVALVVMALATSMLAGPMVRALVGYGQA